MLLKVAVCKKLKEKGKNMKEKSLNFGGKIQLSTI